MTEILFADSADAIAGGEPTLVDLVDRLLDRGVVLRGELWLTVADVDLAFVGVEVVLASHDRMHAAATAK